MYSEQKLPLKRKTLEWMNHTMNVLEITENTANFFNCTLSLVLSFFKTKKYFVIAKLTQNKHNAESSQLPVIMMSALG